MEKLTRIGQTIEDLHVRGGEVDLHEKYPMTHGKENEIEKLKYQHLNAMLHNVKDELLLQKIKKHLELQKLMDS